MFDFDEEPDEDSESRYYNRIRSFQRDGKPYPQLRHHALWLLHNCVAHPVLAIWPTRGAVEFHQLTSNWLNHRPEAIGLPQLPEVRKRRAWVVHNLVAHLLIGLIPCRHTFQWHDQTAREMEVPGWV